MKRKTIIFETIHLVNDKNEVEPNEYKVFEDGILIIYTNDFAYALQAYINRVNH